MKRPEPRQATDDVMRQSVQQALITRASRTFDFEPEDGDPVLPQALDRRLGYKAGFCGGLTSQRNRRGCRHKVGIGEQIAAPRHGPQQTCARRSKCAADLVHAASQRIFGDDHIRPERRQKVILRDDPARMTNQVGKKREGFGAKPDIVRPAQQPAGSKVQRQVGEAELLDGPANHTLYSHPPMTTGYHRVPKSQIPLRCRCVAAKSNPGRRFPSGPVSRSPGL